MRATFVMLCLAGCFAAFGQGATPLVDSIPEKWTYDEHFEQTPPEDDAWWRNFQDPMLDSLINLGMTYNYNMAMALDRIDVAKRNLDLTRAAYYPTLSLQAGWNKSRMSGMNGPEAGRATDASYFSAGITMNWEIDVFGRIYAKSKQGKAAVNVSRADYAAMQVSLAAQIADAYITLRTYQAQLQVAKEHIASQQHILAMTEARHEAGLASMLDVSQARVVLYSTQASIPGLEAAIKSTINTLTVLVGRFPDSVNMGLAEPRPLPGVFHNVGIGIPADLLRRRPDILEAECQLAEAATAVGIAKKDYLPTLSLNGSIGTSAHNIGDLFSKESLTYSIAPTLSWTIFSGFSRKYSEIQAREQMDVAIDSYNFTVQTAVEEVDNAIITYAGTLQNIAMLEQTVAEANRSLELSVDLYRNSLSPFTNVVTSQMNYLTYQNSLISAQGNALQSLVNLYKALGGGWKVYD